MTNYSRRPPSRSPGGHLRWLFDVLERKSYSRINLPKEFIFFRGVICRLFRTLVRCFRAMTITVNSLLRKSVSVVSITWCSSISLSSPTRGETPKKFLLFCVHLAEGCPLLRDECSEKERESTARVCGWDGCSRKENYKSFDETSHVRKRGVSLSIGGGWLVASSCIDSRNPTTLK